MKKFIRWLIELAFIAAIGYIAVEYKGFKVEQYLLAIIGLCLLYLFMRYKRKKRLLHATLKKIDQMDGVKFEEYLMYQFKKKGYRVQMTPISGDFGADLILKKRRKRYVVQAKRYSGSVGIKAVQEIIGAKQYYDIENGMVVTNSYFTKAAKELAEASDITLWGRNEIAKEFNIESGYRD